jgi:hypothetical protein
MLGVFYYLCDSAVWPLIREMALSEGDNCVSFRTFLEFPVCLTGKSILSV